MKLLYQNRIYFTLALFFLISFNSFSQPVKLSEAEQIYESFFEKKTGTNPFSLKNIQVDSFRLAKNKQPSVYNFNSSNHFVLISGLKQVKPVLAYSLENDFNLEGKIPSNVQGLMDFYSEVIRDMRQKDSKKSRMHPGWENLSLTSFDKNVQKSVSPLLNTEWDQGEGWNQYCPVDSAGPGNHVFAGCVAVAMGQAMTKYNHPDTGQGTKTLGTDYGVLTADFSNTDYQWAQMSNTNPDQHNALLLYHCGISVNMFYSPEGSGAYTRDVASALKKYFDYSPELKFISKYNDAQKWADTLKSQLDKGYPIVYSGNSQDGTGGHAFNLDGYDNNGGFHVNWGWSGQFNGYYSLDNLVPSSGHDYSYGQGAVLNIKPFDHSPRNISISSNKVTELQDSSTLVGILSTEDPDENESFEYALEENEGINGDTTGKADFFIVDDSLKTNKVFQYGENNDRKIKITTEDKEGLTLTKEFTIHITEYNHPPDSILLSDNTIKENSGINTVVGKFETIDQDDTTHTYTFIDSLLNGQEHHNNFFSIDQENCLVLSSRINVGGYEHFLVGVQSADNSGKCITDFFTIDIIEDTTKYTDVHSVPLYESVEMFPNPVKNTLTVKIPDSVLNSKLCVYTIKGEKIYESLLLKNRITLTGNHLKKGINIVVIKKQNNILYRHHIIKR